MIPSILYSIKVADWPGAQFSRGEVRIPRVCPNCMSEDIRWNWRIDHKYPFSSTRYTQTFYYCDACNDLMVHDNTTRRIQFWVFVVLAIAFIGGAIAVSDQRGPQSAVQLLLIGAFVVPTIAVLLIAAMRRGGKALHPHALGRRPAAYYTGHSIITNKHMYRARRQEWIDHLIAINPDSASDQDYQARIGQPKPDTKPF